MIMYMFPDLREQFYSYVIISFGVSIDLDLTISPTTSDI